MSDSDRRRTGLLRQWNPTFKKNGLVQVAVERRRRENEGSEKKKRRSKKDGIAIGLTCMPESASSLLTHFAIEKCAANDAFWRTLEDLTQVKKLACVNAGLYHLLAPTNTALPFCYVYARAMRLHRWAEACDWFNWKKNNWSNVYDTLNADERKMKLVSRIGGHSAQLFPLEKVLDYLTRHAGGMQAYAQALIRYRKGRCTHTKRQTTFTLKHLNKTASFHMSSMAQHAHTAETAL